MTNALMTDITFHFVVVVAAYNESCISLRAASTLLRESIEDARRVKLLLFGHILVLFSSQNLNLLHQDNCQTSHGKFRNLFERLSDAVFQPKRFRPDLFHLKVYSHSFLCSL